MLTTDQLFNDWYEWASFADVFVQNETLVMGVNTHDPQELRNLFEMLPEATRDIAHCWGLSDTVFRDEAYVWFRDRASASSPS